MNFSRVAGVDSIVVNLRGDGEGQVARSSLCRTMTSCKVLGPCPHEGHRDVAGGEEGRSLKISNCLQIPSQHQG